MCVYVCTGGGWACVCVCAMCAARLTAVLVSELLFDARSDHLTPIWQQWHPGGPINTVLKCTCACVCVCVRTTCSHSYSGLCSGYRHPTDPRQWHTYTHQDDRVLGVESPLWVCVRVCTCVSVWVCACARVWKARPQVWDRVCYCTVWRWK